MPNNFKKFKKAPLILSIVLMGIACFIFIFLYRQINNNEQASGDLEMQWQDEASKREEIKSLDRMLKAIESERLLLGTHFIQNSNVAPFLDSVEKSGPKIGATVEIAQVDIPKDNTALVVSINASGRFEDLYKFLTLLENSPYELEITSMDLQQLQAATVIDKKSTPSKWSAVFKIKLLSFIL